MFTDYYAEQSCTAGRSSFITGQCTLRTGLTKVGMPGAPVGLQERRPDDRRAAEAARLRHRPVRQEPPRRPQRIPADRPRVRRVLRQPLSPQRRGGAGAARPIRAIRSSGEVRPARRAAVQGDGPGRPDRRSALRPGRQADHRGHRRRSPRSGWRRSTTRRPTAAIDFIKRQAQADKPFFCWFNATRMHFRTHVRPSASQPAGADGQDRIRRRHGRARRPRRQGAQGARRSRHRRQHDRDLHDRQRPAHEHLAGRRDDAVPQREEHQLGRRLPRAVHDPLAGPDQARLGLERDRQRRSTGCRRCWRRPANPTSRSKLLKGLQGRRQDVQGPSRRLQSAALPDRAAAERVARKEFFYFNDDGDLVALRYENWKIVFCEQRAPGTLRVWAEPFTSCACPSCSTCAPTPTSGPTSPRTPITTGSFDAAYLILRRPGGRRRVPRHVQGISAEPAAGELQHRPDASRKCRASSRPRK